MIYAEEGVGVARAAAASGIPSVISFTVETDGRLPSGQPLGQAIAQVDQETGGSLNILGGCWHGPPPRGRDSQGLGR